MAEFILGFVLFGIPAMFITAFIIVKNKCDHDYRNCGVFHKICNKCGKIKSMF